MAYNGKTFEGKHIYDGQYETETLSDAVKHFNNKYTKIHLEAIEASDALYDVRVPQSDDFFENSLYKNYNEVEKSASHEVFEKHGVVEHKGADGIKFIKIAGFGAFMDNTIENYTIVSFD